jgi:hypothetical protein
METEINDRIVKIMNEAGLTPAAFARETGIGDQTVRQVLVAKRNKPGFDFLAKVVLTFKWVNAYWLLTGEGDERIPEHQPEVQKPVEVVAQPMTPAPAPQPQTPSVPDSFSVDTNLLIYIREKDRRIEELVEQATIWKMRYMDLTNRAK